MPVSTETLRTLEDQLDRLYHLSQVRPPALLSGPINFFKSLPEWLGQGNRNTGTTVLLPEPSLNLSSPYPRDELAMALATARGAEPSPGNVVKAASALGIGSELLDRPTSALSGGEKMLLCLAKAEVLSVQARGVCICSPFFWLDGTNRQRVQSTLSANGSNGKEAHLLLLSGEQEDESTPTGSPAREQALQWSLNIKDLSVVFPRTTFPKATVEKILKFRSASPRISLRSPTLVTGANGSGKTAFAKIVSNALRASTGKASAETGGYGGPSRLIMQDSVLQLFCEDPSARSHRIFRFDSERMKTYEKVHQELVDRCIKRLGIHEPSLAIGQRDTVETLLQAKIVLVAERLCARPPLLILDEPGWCLSRAQAWALIEATTGVAHEQGTAILIISHQRTWWIDLANSYLEFTVGHDQTETILS